MIAFISRAISIVGRYTLQISSICFGITILGHGVVTKSLHTIDETHAEALLRDVKLVMRCGFPNSSSTSEFHLQLFIVLATSIEPDTKKSKEQCVA